MAKPCPTLGVALYLDCLDCDDKQCQEKQYKYNKVIIGIDQSYTRTGISVAADGKLLIVKSMSFKGAKTKTDKRKALADRLYSLLTNVRPKASELLVICEKIRTFSHGGKAGGNSFISTNYIKSTGALIATIVDTAYAFDVPVCSVDTRSWKSRVVGTSKGGKEPTIDFVRHLGFDISIHTKKGVKYDDDAADSACIALYGFLDEKQQKLNVET